ncbi:hypothetical protein CRU86_09410 [Aliarcobacter skirrowii]|uniref:Uncharacterized protein n=2 Tax=Aliarcobacter TaxID=2321111 RepID=A0A5R9H1J9_9BACT|nr:MULTISPECIES: hypothetical protein [Aliarcobacter]MDX4036114.1 hypothetical protein [Aliarcobacter skirrowii]RXJ75060.1 hypothetical protein CRU86_09410 [Aliarcobacter skirrowii]TLS71156.1 hypothetical protein FE246_09365 [Aliarcobacter thereius]
MEEEELKQAIYKYLKFRNIPDDENNVIKDNNAMFFTEIIADFYSWRTFSPGLNNFQNKRELKNALNEFIESGR